jgi:hypothetical protein
MAPCSHAARAPRIRSSLDIHRIPQAANIGILTAHPQPER